MPNTILQQSLTMLTASETRQLSTAAQELDQLDESLIYKYRDEFLHIQSAAVNGLTKLEMLVEDPQEFSQVCIAWGFTTLVQDKISSKIVYSKAQAQQTIESTTANITVDWTTPRTPTIDVDLYRQSGNLVKLQNTQLSIPLLTTLKSKFQVSDAQYQVAQSIVDEAVSGNIITSSKTGLGLELEIRITPNTRYTIVTILNPGKGYTQGDQIRISSYQLNNGDSLDRWSATVYVEQVAKQRLINPSSGLRGMVTSGVDIIELGGVTQCRIEGNTGPSVGGTVYWSDSQITGSTIKKYK